MKYQFSPTLRLGCPAYYCFKKVFKYKPETPAPLVGLVGSAIHRVAENLFTGAWKEKDFNGSRACMSKVLDETINESVVKGKEAEQVSKTRWEKELVYLGKLFESFMNAREKILRLYEVLSVEQKYEVEILPYVTMTGILDLELKDKKGIFWAWDWKSNRRIPRFLDGRMKSQAAYYTFFLSKQYKVPIQKTGMIFCFLGRANPVYLEIKGSKSLLKGELFKLKEFIRETREGVFKRVKSRENCRWCEYRDSCSLVEEDQVEVKSWKVDESLKTGGGKK